MAAPQYSPYLRATQPALVHETLALRPRAPDPEKMTNNHSTPAAAEFPLKINAVPENGAVEPWPSSGAARGSLTPFTRRMFAILRMDLEDWPAKTERSKSGAALHSSLSKLVADRLGYHTPTSALGRELNR